ITSRRENSGKVQNYTYFQGSEVASFGNANAPELANAYAMTWRSDYVASPIKLCSERGRHAHAHVAVH
ncbi:MAG: hypothetical protein U0998_10120, partial [Moraxellaceae bacterium]|nr:hypothetical protein [Moraxellaceae bacterium]MDZ4387529.1 hypothetical protein [Moraxellaceae bacterium]